jgi:hypothetical protein
MSGMASAPTACPIHHAGTGGIVPAPMRKRDCVPLTEHLNLDMFTRTISLEVTQKVASFKLGPCEIQIRTQGLKYGQHLIPGENTLTTRTKWEHIFSL